MLRRLDFVDSTMQSRASSSFSLSRFLALSLHREHLGLSSALPFLMRQDILTVVFTLMRDVISLELRLSRDILTSWRYTSLISSTGISQRIRAGESRSRSTHVLQRLVLCVRVLASRKISLHMMEYRMAKECGIPRIRFVKLLLMLQLRVLM